MPSPGITGEKYRARIDLAASRLLFLLLILMSFSGGEKKSVIYVKADEKLAFDSGWSTRVVYNINA